MTDTPNEAQPLEAFVRQAEPALAAAIQQAQDVAAREGCTDCGDQHRQLAAWLRRLVRMEHDFPRLSEFHHKHALGPMLPPSCLVCGQMTGPAELEAEFSVAIQHAELPGIVVCKRCRDAATPPNASHRCR